MKVAIPLLFAIVLGACQPVPSVDPANGLVRSSPEWRGQRFAQNRCSDCHSVGYGETSPRPDAPSFSAIAASPGLDAAKLAQWLRDHRNYPDEMYFEIPAEHIDDLAAYMLTLRRGEPDAE
ncbi:hypothetical protein GCM10011515_15400 [Tsuneonella deserti]|uniref:Cytochrome c domain-containing protein n=1 Tax=Tsuneonella deserti TaxID=2035528 RepID=A0ABQ1S6E7_9SPHN|nr:c-type cytochrome [Tsuneonella deserti]GGD96418.1 hypothetical protein GCM10011515_15400 [Tsuneonella deserti]